MCGRTAISRKVGYYAEQFNVYEVSEEAQNFKPSQNISCGTYLPILVANGDKRAFKLCHWGISFENDGKLITTMNSRSETIKEIFPKSLYHKRCVLVCDGYYEWKKISEKLREPYFFYLENSPMLMAAIYDESKTTKALCFSVLTVNAGNNVSFIHNRQPFLLTNDAINKWLHGSSAEIDELLSVGIRENDDMIDCVKFHPVHEKMNSTHYQGDDCMKMKKSSAIPICNYFKTSPKKETINSSSAPTTGQNEEKDALTHFELQHENDNSHSVPQDFCPVMVSESIDGSAATANADIVGMLNSTSNTKLSQCDHVIDFIDHLNLYYCKVCDVYSDRIDERAQASSDKSTPVKAIKPPIISASNSTPVKTTKKKSPLSSNSSTPAKSTKKRRIENPLPTASKITSFFTKKETM